MNLHDLRSSAAAFGRAAPCATRTIILAAALLPLLATGPALATSAEAVGPAAKSLPTKPTSAPPQKAKSKADEPEMTMDDFLDRLMVAESGGRDTAKNPLSTATGAFQFIQSTFLSVMRRHYPKRIENLDPGQILALRTDRKTARDAARAYTQDNAQILAANGHRPTFPHLRLAFLLGANGAMRVLEAKPGTPLAPILGPTVMRANPFMRRHTAGSLIARAAREVSLSPTAVAGIAPIRDPKTGKIIMPARAARPRIRVRCNLARPSCKRWLALKRKRMNATARRLAKN